MFFFSLKKRGKDDELEEEEGGTIREWELENQTTQFTQICKLDGCHLIMSLIPFDTIM